ncbi:hypothetical protein C7999DRAFT_29638 [Corynascus novoguineensis]|uniref:Uncharacterized protein n=1 Tax=Corynascus novoguineensis TaxID=1126955 RepID=A0AAN7HLR1_9PEZI|nr:hypothetical protein C7999DRAFT_29638 [Corynascus novoguineensis]
MAIKIAACRTCAPYLDHYMERRSDVTIMRHIPGRNGRSIWKIDMAGDARTSDYKSLFAMAWRAASNVQFYCYGTKVVDNMICCTDY